MADQADVQHEYSDFKLWVVAVGGGATAVLIAVSLLAAWGLFRHFDRREREAKASTIPLAAEEREPFGGQPPLEGLPQRVQRDDAERLERYGWVDRDKGVVYVPLERAEREALGNRDKYLKSRPAK